MDKKTIWQTPGLRPLVVAYCVMFSAVWLLRPGSITVRIWIVGMAVLVLSGLLLIILKHFRWIVTFRLLTTILMSFAAGGWLMLNVRHRPAPENLWNYSYSFGWPFKFFYYSYEGKHFISPEIAGFDIFLAVVSILFLAHAFERLFYRKRIGEAEPK